MASNSAPASVKFFCPFFFHLMLVWVFFYFVCLPSHLSTSHLSPIKTEENDTSLSLSLSLSLSPPLSLCPYVCLTVCLSVCLSDSLSLSLSLSFSLSLSLSLSPPPSPPRQIDPFLVFWVRAISWKLEMFL